MLGAIFGDTVGSRFEWHNIKTKEFDLLPSKCFLTDDSFMTMAIAKAILDNKGDLKESAVKWMQKIGRLYPDGGYGTHFESWLYDDYPMPYNSWGNGSAMRVSACGYAGNTIDEVKKLSEEVTSVTHNHPEGLKGAEATAVAIYLARTGKTIDEIKKYVIDNYYNIDFTLDEIRDAYDFDVSCQGTVPQALEAFFESDCFEDAIRNAISIGGDSDTLAAITGSVAEAYYGIPENLREDILSFLDDYQKEIVFDFEKKYPPKKDIFA